jgi:hypothetical protein
MSQLIFLKRMERHAKRKSIANPSEMQSRRLKKNAGDAGISRTPRSGARKRTGMEYIKSIGTQPPTVCAIS